MTKARRVLTIFEGIMMILGAIVILSIPDSGYIIVILILSLSLIIYGIRKIIYYFTMARYSVGGRSILYGAVLALDFGMLMLSFSSLPGIYLAFYLGLGHLISGAIDIYNALEAKKLASPSWKRKAVEGTVNTVVAVVAIVAGFTTKSVIVFVYIYSIGLIYSAILKLISVFRKTAIVYIQ